MENAMESIDREENIAKNIDAFGRQWKVAHFRGSNLYGAKSDQLREGTTIPKKIAGKWTKVMFLENAIKDYVTATWEEAAEKAKRAPGKERAKKQKAEEEKVSAGSESDKTVSPA